MKTTFIALIVSLAAAALALQRVHPQNKYVPAAQYCADGSAVPCSIVSAYIGPDPSITGAGFGYVGLFKPFPTSPANDVQTPFDNMAWQMFIAVNWPADAVKQPASRALTMPGRRVWQNFRKVSSLFGNSKVQAPCTSALALPILSIGSDGKGKPSPKNEEYFQASTNRPLIDINGNWTIFERRVNDIEAKYLTAPNRDPSQTLTTIAGQTKFVKGHPEGAQFTASSTVQTGSNGSIEIKTAWRIIDKNAGDDPSRYYTQEVFIAVAGDLVNGGRSFCETATVGLVGMHIMQRNPVDKQNPQLRPEWIWATFEHVDNAPVAEKPCTVDNGCGKNAPWLDMQSCGAAAPDASKRYSFYNQNLASQPTNVIPLPKGTGNPAYPWNRQRPHAKGNTTPATANPQVARCWSIYPTTAEINSQWQTTLASLKSVFQHYMLIGTQWGGNVEPPKDPNYLPDDAVPAMLSNMTLETYIQNYTKATPDGGPGSCISCHRFATLAALPQPTADFSFLPSLVDLLTARSRVTTAK
jgi:hypothetical protein